MKTDEGCRPGKGCPSWLLVKRRTPWVLLVALSLVFWVVEGLVHVWFFGGEHLLSAVLHPTPHETWMRLLVVVMMGVVGVVWTAAIRSRTRQIAKLEEYQNRLADMSARYATGESEERRELADKLHEEVGQSLAAARMFLGTLESDGTDSCTAGVRSIERIIERAIADCRDIAQQLSPPVLDEYGLEPALEALAKRVTRQSGVTVRLETGTDGGAPLARETLLAAFQALAEVIEGAARTPGTSVVQVTADGRADGVQVTVRWDSRMDDDFWAVRERISRSGGWFEHSTGDAWTEVIVGAPYLAV